MAESTTVPIELPGLRVTVDRVAFNPNAQTPADRPYCFVYYITIHNDSDVTVTIKGRKWVVRSDDGEILTVEGAGVVGQTPFLQIGESFTYNSHHLLRTKSATAEGAYIGLDSEGRAVVTRIPKFEMILPGGD
ncbi:MAG: Co(2+)/Mg(2+) efflux protein ApaG [Limisphaerales bacterium]